MLKNASVQISSVLSDIRKVVSDNSMACQITKEKIIHSECIFADRLNHPKDSFQLVR